MEQLNNPLFIFDFTKHIDSELNITLNKNWDLQGITPIEKNLEDLKSWCVHFCKKWTFQLEKGEDTGKFHFQGRISLKNKTRLSTMIKTHLGFHWSITSNESKNNMFYVSKEETRMAGPWSDNDIAPKILPQHKVDKWYPFQQSIIDSINSKFDTRTVNCLIDSNGNQGKSTLVGFLDQQKLACKIPFCNEFRDIMRLVMNKQDAFYNVKNSYYKCFFIDIPRAMKQDKLVGMYAAIESLKDGYVYDDRYSFRDMHFASPVVWVFTNTQPNISYLSADRWKFWYIDDSHHLLPINRNLNVPQILNTPFIPSILTTPPQL